MNTDLLAELEEIDNQLITILTDMLQEYRTALVRLDELLLSTFRPLHDMRMYQVNGKPVDQLTLDKLDGILNRMYAVMPESIVKAGKNEAN